MVAMNWRARGVVRRLNVAVPAFCVIGYRLVRSALAMALLLLGSLLPFTAWAQPSASSVLPDVEDIRTMRADVEANADLSDEAKKAIAGLLQSTQAVLERQSDRTRQLDQYDDEQARENEIREQLSREARQSSLGELPPEGTTLSALRRILDQRRLNRVELGSRLRALESRSEALQVRDAEIARNITAANDRLGELGSNPQLAPAQTPGSVAEARTLLESVTRRERLQAVDDLQAELASLPSRNLILTARINLVNQQLDELDRRISDLEDRVANAERRAATELLGLTGDQVRKAAREEPALLQAARRNRSLARELIPLVNQPLPDDGQLRKQSRRIAEISSTVARILDTQSVSDTVVSLLRELRSDLPEVELVQEQTTEVENLRTELELRLIVWQEKARSVTGNSGQSDLASDIARTHATVLTTLIERAQETIGTVRIAETLLADTLDKTRNLNNLLDRRSVWLRSSEPLSMSWVGNLAPGIAWLTSHGSWTDAVAELIRQILARPIQSLLIILITVYLISRRRAMNRRLDEIASHVGRVGEDTYWSTPFAILISALLAMPLPFLLWATAFFLSRSDAATTFQTALVESLYALSWILFSLLMFRTLCRSNGVFDTHFGWSDRARRSLRRHLTWFSASQGICTLVLVMMVVPNDPALRYGVGTLAFVIGSLGITIFAFVFFRPVKGIFYRIFDVTESSALAWLACLLLITLPLAIGLMPLLGFFDTALQLQMRVFQSGFLLLLAAVVYGLLGRYFLVAQRRFALSRARQRLAETRAARLADGPEAAGDAMPTPALHATVDQEKIGIQTRNLLRVASALLLIAGLMFIWRTFLPALAAAQDIILWQSSSLLDGAISTEPVSLWNLILSMILIFGTIVAVKNIRGPLELGLFERMKLAPGERYAAVTVIGYVLVSAGVIAGLSQLGIQWAKLQWIVAALGVGLGFGLQEIVANFVSGLILLFERPIRIGDTVTIGKITGTVRNIRIRATTITDFDNHDVIIPNNSVTTENVINWTLHDAVTRLRLHVSVSYDSDIEEVQRIIMNVIEAHPDVVEDPAPNTFFMGYGNGALMFDILVFFDSPLKYLTLTHDVNRGVNQALTEAGFEIPQPRQEMRIISSNP